MKTESLNLYLCGLERRIVIVVKFMLGDVSVPASIQPSRLFENNCVILRTNLTYDTSSAFTGPVILLLNCDGCDFCRLQDRQ